MSIQISYFLRKFSGIIFMMKSVFSSLGMLVAARAASAETDWLVVCKLNVKWTKDTIVFYLYIKLIKIFFY